MNQGAPRPNTIVFIHGLWMTPLSWENWQQRYTEAGYEVLAPAWPGMEATVEALRAAPSSIARIELGQVIDHYDSIIRALDSKPIVVGHSFGGLVTQVLLDRGLGASGVAIHPAPPRGVPGLPLSTLKAASPVLANPFNYGKAVPLTPAQFHYAFTNNMSEEQSRAAYDRYHVPAAARVLFQGAFANFNPKTPASVNVRNHKRAPLLLVAGGDDNIVPARLVKANLKRYGQSKAVTQYVEFPGRSHFTVGQPGWQNVADHVLRWAEHQAVDASSVS